MFSRLSLFFFFFFLLLLRLPLGKDHASLANAVETVRDDPPVSCGLLDRSEETRDERFQDALNTLQLHQQRVRHAQREIRAIEDSNGSPRRRHPATPAAVLLDRPCVPPLLFHVAPHSETNAVVHGNPAADPPPQSREPNENVNANANARGQELTNRSRAQRERRARERAQRITQNSDANQRRRYAPLDANDGRDANLNRGITQQNRRSEAQRSRRARERDAVNMDRNANQAHVVRTEGPAQGLDRTNHIRGINHRSHNADNGPQLPDNQGGAIQVFRVQNAPDMDNNNALGPFLAARRAYQDPASRHDLGRMDIPCPSCGALHWQAEKLSRSTPAAPRFGMCCNQGQVRLPPLLEPPPALRALFIGDDTQSKEFRLNIRQYNFALAFTSLGVDDCKTVNSRGGWVFKILGQLYHRSGALIAAPGEAARYSQLYVFDPAAALQQRMQRNDKLRYDTMETLQNVLEASHHYAAVYKHAYEALSDYDDAEDVSVRLRVMPGQDRRRYNLPSADEVAVILPGDGSQGDKRDIILRKRMPEGLALYRISDLHPAYEPLHYVLLFPHGEHGWYPALREYQPGRPVPRRLSKTRYTAYRLQVRPDEFSTILRGGRLLQQYMVDMWASADQNRLSYLRNNQNKLRASIYSGLEDAVNAADGAVDLNQLGTRFILPSSYIGGPRHMQQRFQDAMAIARYFRKVDIFMTVTANPQWEEITRELLPGQTSFDRPDLVARVFQMKKEAILDDIYKNGIFGSAVAYVYTIEFQKRGLPHMHLLIVLKEPYKLLSPASIDSAIWARWPDPVTQPLLFETVKKCMVHGPCGAFNPNAPCMENGRCTKFYPKPFQPYTTMDHDGYPNYYRPNDGRAYVVRNKTLDNRWIVPYSPYLSAKYDCHINVECAATVRSIKYPFKYIHKGGDRATLEIDKDEIKTYIDGRYIAASESAWRIFHFDMHDQIPNIVRLQVHLPGQHMVTFDPDEPAEVVIARASHERTTLTQFFAMNAHPEYGEIAKQYTYQEFPQHFVWKGESRGQEHWVPRQRGFALGRMYFVPPTGGERFYLRTLLTVVKGPMSFSDLRTYQGIEYPTFQDACLARGLLEDDGEWRICLREASEMQVGSALRQLFATILLFGPPQRPDELWNEFRQYVCDDLARRLTRLGVLNPTDDQIYDYGLYLLDQLLRESGYRLQDFPRMPLPQINWNLNVENRLIAEQLNYDPENEKTNALARVEQLNTDQRSAYDKIMESISQELGKVFFLNGPGGTGKTFVYNTVAARVRGEGWIIICTASCGIAALLLRGGRTSHSAFKIPIEGLNDHSFCSIPKESQRAELLRATRAFIWDEALMHHRHCHEAFDRTMRDITGIDRPFGGKTIIFGGDFQQTLPVVPKGSREEILAACLQKSYLWEHVKVLELRENMRLQMGLQAEVGLHDEATQRERLREEQHFANWLLDIGHGRNIADDGTIALPESMRCDSTNSLINFIYPGIDGPTPPPEYFLDRTILSPRNSDVDELNLDILRRMRGEERVYFSADSIVREPGADPSDVPDDIPIEYLHTLDASGLPPGELHLKLGSPVIILRNLAPTRGLCNGTRTVVRRMAERVIEVQLIGGEHHGETALIPRIKLTPSGKDNEFAFKLQRIQFPARPAFAMSIHRAQGQSVRHVGVDLRVPVFTHGQLYVALSRATSSRRVRLLLPDSTQEARTTNVVYPEIFNSYQRQLEPVQAEA